ncbi:hypothetical protein Ahy_B08g093027 [Arachis hypogaea]|uniref:Uncharacterized protein n=1 Tax=Arachis hypogaea TaxID=3818 RepID=A0A444Y5A4_ARAHY|nr:hypothetical protein Ahy_B08g093027 [Arachis hypogaea]
MEKLLPSLLGMSTGRGAANQAAGHGHSCDRCRGRVSSVTLGTSGSPLSTPTTLLTPQVAGLTDQPFIMVPNPNYVPPSMATTLPPTAQQPTSTSTLPPTMDAEAPESSHSSEPATNAPSPPPIVRLKILPDGGMVDLVGWLFLCCRCTLGETLSTTLQSGRYSTIEWIGGTSRCWMMFKALFVHWEIDEGFRYRHPTNRANRALTRSSKYTGDSATFRKMKARLSQSLDCKVMLAKTFNYTHMLKENKEIFDDQQSHDHYIKSYTQRLEAVTQQSQEGGEDAADGSTAVVIDPDALH